MDTRKRTGRTISGRAVFLLRINKEHFFVRLDNDGLPLGVAIPSVAAHMSYEEADVVCQQIKARGYMGAVVCDVMGRMVDVKALAAIANEDVERAQRFWG